MWLQEAIFPAGFQLIKEAYFNQSEASSACWEILPNDVYTKACNGLGG